MSLKMHLPKGVETSGKWMKRPSLWMVSVPSEMTGVISSGANWEDVSPFRGYPLSSHKQLHQNPAHSFWVSQIFRRLQKSNVFVVYFIFLLQIYLASRSIHSVFPTLVTSTRHQGVTRNSAKELAWGSQHIAALFHYLFPFSKYVIHLSSLTTKGTES